MGYGSSVEEVFNNPIVQGVTDFATGGASAPYFAVADAAQGNYLQAAGQAIGSFGGGTPDLSTAQLTQTYINSGMSAADAASAAAQATAAGGLVDSGAGAYQGIAGAVDAAGGYNALTENPSMDSLVKSGAAGGQISAPAVAGISSTAPTGVSATSTAPATPSAGVAAPAGAGAPAVEGADVTSLGAPQTPATATLPATTPVQTAGIGAEQAPAPVAEGVATGPAGVTTGAEHAAVAPDYLTKGLNALKNISPTTALTGAGLGMNAYSQYQQKKAMGDMQQQIKNAVAPLSSTQQNLMAQYNSGQLNASDSQAIDQYITQQTAQIKQQYASMGQGGSPQEAQAIAAVEAQRGAMTDQALQNYLTSALQTTNAMTGPYASLSQQQLAQDAQLQNAAGNVFKAIGAQQSGQPATP